MDSVADVAPTTPGVVHAPATAPVDAADAQRHAVQPDICAATELQQQPPRHAPVEQSYGDAHESPELTVRHAPVVGLQEEQPRRADEFEQQKPPRQDRDEHAEFEAHDEPGADDVTARTLHADTEPPPAKAVVVPAGHGVGSSEPAGQ